MVIPLFRPFPPPESPLTDGIVILRLPREADAPAIAAACRDPEIARWIPVPVPYDLEDARAFVAAAIEGKSAVASNAPFLAECGIATLPGVRSGIDDREELRALCAAADVGISSADYALADTGSLVMISSPREARLVSLLPPAHIAVVPRDRILTGLDELFSILPNPADVASSMVLITGPSRTADIEQILVRGVHGPGQITVVVVG